MLHKTLTCLATLLLATPLSCEGCDRRALR